jgi:transcriptional regulator with PAS, ATPase and Fis domain
MQEGKFREDLFYRLNVLPLDLPSLRERDGDIPLLIRYFLHRHGARKGKMALQIESAAMAALEHYNWPGNVREVENLVERLVVLNDDGIIHLSDLPDYVIHNSVPQHQRATQAGLPTDGLDLDGMLEKIENGFIEQALLRARGNKTMAAELLRLNRTTLIERLRKKGMLQSARGAPVRPEHVEKMTGENHTLTGPLFAPWNTLSPLPGEA